MSSKYQPQIVEKRVLVTVKAYPNPSSTYRETVCVAGITDEGNFIRIYPVRFRDLADDNKFKLYTWIKVRVFKASGDRRPESYHLDSDSPIEVEEEIPSSKWAERSRWLRPLCSPSLESLKVAQQTSGTSLGVIRPREILELVIEPEDEPDWTPQERAKLMQQELFASPASDRERPLSILEKIPVRIAYRFRCDETSCQGHDIKVISWEVLQTYRKWRRQYGEDNWEAHFRKRYLNDMQARDLHFFMGNMARHQGTFLIIGLYYPPKPPPAPPSLWDSTQFP